MRIGNAASEQFQLDVYGEVIGVAYIGAEALGRIEHRYWPRWRTVVEHVETIWQRARRRDLGDPGAAQHFTYSKVMAWVVFDRAVQTGRAVRPRGARWSAGRRSATRSTTRSASGASTPSGSTFTQYYGSKELDASVLNIPLVGFLPGDDERVTGTIDAITRELGRDGFVSRYSTADTDDGLSGDEGQFLACSFWLVSALAVNGRVDEARALFERLIGLSNDLGLLSEEYDVGAPAPGRQLPPGLQPSDLDRRGLRDRGKRNHLGDRWAGAVVGHRLRQGCGDGRTNLQA